MSQTILPPVAVEYPSGDGKPMAENYAQLLALLCHQEEAASRREVDAARRVAESRAEREATLRHEEVAARRAAEARIAELEALLRGQNR